MREFTFIWSIQNYGYCSLEAFDKLESATFYVDMMQGTFWNLHLYPKGKGEQDFIALYLNRCGSCKGPEKIALNYRFCIVDANGRALDLYETCALNVEFPKNEATGFSDCCKRPIILEGGSALNTLTVQCTMWVEERVDKKAVGYATTEIGIEKISFVNTIENFAALEPSEMITFDVTVSALKISTVVYIRGEDGLDDEDTVKISLDSEIAHLMTCQIDLLNSAGKGVKCGEIDTRNDMYRLSELPAQLHIKRKTLDEKHDYLPNDKLTLRFECTISNGKDIQRIDGTFNDLDLMPLIEKVHLDTRASSTSEPKSLSSDLETLYQDRILSDIEIKTASRIFPAHKSVLCARSPVFSSMLTNDMKEKTANCIQIDDLEASTVEQLLLFLYTDRVENFEWESIKMLYFAADKYEVRRLKAVCTSLLITGLNNYNTSDLLLLADRHQDSDLKTAVERYICQKNAGVFCNDEWEIFMEREPILAMKTMYLYLKNSKKMTTT